MMDGTDTNIQEHDLFANIVYIECKSSAAQNPEKMR